MRLDPDDVRRALRRHASTVVPDDSLDPMRGMPERIRAVRRARVVTSVATAAAVLVVALLVPEALSALRTRGAPPAGPPTATASASQSAPAGTPTPTPEVRSPAVPVYYLSGGRLAREFRQLRAPAERVAAAVDAMLRLPPLDPDYRSGWPAQANATVTTTAGGYAVDVSAAPLAGCLAVQQLVHTVTAAAGADGAVVVRVGGRPVGALPGLRGCDATRTGAVRRAPQRALLVGVQVSSPNEGDLVPLRFELVGHSRVRTGSLTWAVTDRVTGDRLGGGAPAALGDSPAGWTVHVELPSSAAGRTVVVTVSGRQPDGSSAVETKQLRIAD